MPDLTDPRQVEDLRTRVDAVLREFLARRSLTLAKVSPDCLQIGYAISGLTSTAAALEPFQTAAWIHDDLMDASDVQRGMPTVHLIAASSARATVAWKEPTSPTRPRATCLLVWSRLPPPGPGDWHAEPVQVEDKS